MPVGTSMPTDNQLVKLLLTGNSKTGKTHYAMTAAEAGFKVLYLDGDVSRPTIQSFSRDSLTRLFHLPFEDMVAESGQYVPRFALLLRKFLKDGVFVWNDTKRRMVVPASDAGDDVWTISASKLTSEWVCVIDSWTGVAHSVMNAVALDANVDLSEMDKAGLSIYGSANNFATDLLARIRGLPCHVIVIAHPDEYIKYKTKLGSVRDAQRTENREVEYARSIPKSISRPHALTLPSYFTDVGWLEVSAMGKRILNFELTPDRDSGGRFNTKLPVESASFAALVQKAGGTVPEATPITDDGHPAMTRQHPYTPSQQAGTTAKAPSVLNPQGGVAPSVNVKAPAIPLAAKGSNVMTLNLKPKA